jgi:hypothetical protein
MGGMGLVTDASLPDITKPRAFFVTEAWAMSAGEQANGGYCEIPADERANLMFDLAAQGKADLLKLWWHIHPVHGWSITDTNTMRQRVTESRSKGRVAWGLSVVLTPGGFIARYDQAGDEEGDNFFVDMPVYVGGAGHDPAWEEDVKKMLERYDAKRQEIIEQKAKTLDWLDIDAIKKAAMESIKAEEQEAPEIEELIKDTALYAHGGERYFFCKTSPSLVTPDTCAHCSRAEQCYAICISGIDYDQLPLFEEDIL